tara:strand:- start:542 stop:1255 length:714 start_codon:yes stop_codon:yes gene_type:complete
MLKITNISKSFKDKKVIDDISFQIQSGTISGLLGPNGAGKTSIFYIIAGIVRSDRGEIFLNEKNISSLAMHKRAFLGLKYLPQEPSIFQNLTVLENLLGLAEISFKDKDKVSDFIEKSIKEFNLKDIINKKGRVLSGGQRRKVEIARTLASDPKIILLDEPFAGIDPIAVDDIKKTLLNLKKKGIGILITDHNVRESLEICDKALVINAGKKIAEGTKEELINNSVVKKVYFGNLYN